MLGERLLKVATIDACRTLLVLLHYSRTPFRRVRVETRRRNDRGRQGTAHWTALDAARGNSIGRFASRVSPLFDALLDISTVV
jgi:hypothetical protein